MDDAAVRTRMERFLSTLPDPRPSPAAVEHVVTEDGWILAVYNDHRVPLASAQAHLAAVFPDTEVEVRTPVGVHRGGHGFGAGRHVVAVLGGKGGVGKSTTAVNLALTLAAMGRSVGLIDADLNAPDIPHMVGMRPRDADPAVPPALATAAKDPVWAAAERSVRSARSGMSWDLWRKAVAPRSTRRRPTRRFGIEVMSIGLEIGEEAPPLMTSRLVVSALLRQMLFDVAWEADVIVVDAPPGTGIELQAISAELPLSGAVFVTTPQDLAQMDAGRTLTLLERHGVPVIGVVQNMAALECPHCRETVDLFPRSTRLADAGVDVLGRIPFDLRLSEAADRGRPLVLAEPTGPVAREFARIGAAVRRWLIAQDRDDTVAVSAQISA
jgi:ATP-binding protein involved in chromosome partitioning